MNENSNSLKTENSFWQYYPAFWVFRKTKILVPTKKKKKQKKYPHARLPGPMASSVKSSREAGHNTVSIDSHSCFPN